jgi:hypothetical protein
VGLAKIAQRYNPGPSHPGSISVAVVFLPCCSSEVALIKEERCCDLVFELWCLKSSSIARSQNGFCILEGMEEA